MRKRKRSDYIISEREDECERLIFRFYPRRSNCQSINEMPPENWEDVYKVYFSYAIIKQWRLTKSDQWQTIILFYQPCDENSLIREISKRCLLLHEGLEILKRKNGEYFDILDQEMYTWGIERIGTSWCISKIENKLNNLILYEFTLFDYNNKKDIASFGRYLDGCCEYMLAHGEPF